MYWFRSLILVLPVAGQKQLDACQSPRVHRRRGKYRTKQKMNGKITVMPTAKVISIHCDSIRKYPPSYTKRSRIDVLLMIEIEYNIE